MIRSIAPLALILAVAGSALAQLPPAAPAPAAAPSAQVAPAPPGSDITVTGQAREPDPIDGPNVFLSPMGEPFRSDDRLSGAEHWFVHADANRDRRMTRAEYLAEAMAFFASLDTDHDGVIGPDEISHYETIVAPEVTVTSTYGDMSKAKVDSDGKFVEPPYPTRLGAGRYSYVASPEPIVSADSNLDRGITAAEFEQAARLRFKALDANGDGTLVRAELPRLTSPRVR